MKISSRTAASISRTLAVVSVVVVVRVPIGAP